MIQLSFEEAIAKNREMWQWIADESEKRGILVSKTQYLIEHGMAGSSIIAQCFCCEYTRQFHSDSYQAIYCEYCPIHWTEDPNIIDYCSTDDSLWLQWKRNQDEYIKLCNRKTFSQRNDEWRQKRKAQCLVRGIQIAREFASKPAREISDIDFR